MYIYFFFSKKKVLLRGEWPQLVPKCCTATACGPLAQRESKLEWNIILGHFLLFVCLFLDRERER